MFDFRDHPSDKRGIAMSWQKKYQEWQAFGELEYKLKEELDTRLNPNDLEDRFYRYLPFGTGGMRGELGVGTNRINSYTIKRVALGLAKYILEAGAAAAKRGVVISYDNRHFSETFAQWTARILASQGVKAYLSDCLRPTPELSFLVRHYQAYAGVMITASHNPKEYNGFKVYGEDGGQITLDTANRLMAILAEINDELAIEAKDLKSYIQQGTIEIYSSEVDDLYLDELWQVVQNRPLIKEFGSKLEIVYTPLHGTGRDLIKKAFQRVGFSNLRLVEEQEYPDPNFSTVISPNPEDPHAFDLALQKTTKKPADILLATDPDADRLGVVIFKEGRPIFLNGNQIGVLLLDYLIKEKSHKKENLANYFLAKTIVTSDLGAKIAASKMIETRNTLTGFKFIGEQIKRSEEKNEKHFLFGYEESYGYLVAPFVRDKDAIQAATLFAEVALDCHLAGISVVDHLNEIYETYGYYKEQLETKTFLGKDGIQLMDQLSESLRNDSFTKLGHFHLAAKEDYLSSLRIKPSQQQQELLDFPKSNVLKYIFTDGSWVCVRPSGTEPKFKIYYSVNGRTSREVTKKMKELTRAFQQFLKDKESC